MANIEIRDGDGTEKYLKATGAGSAGDPFIPEHLDTNSAAILVAVQAAQAALQILDNIVSGNEAQVDVLTLPADPLGASADAAATAGSTGSISAKLRLMTTQLNTIASALVGTLTVGLPSGAASAANQTTANNALAAIQAAAETLGNAISGDEMQVDVLTLPALPAGTNLLGRISASAETSTVYNGTTALTPKFAKIDVASSGDNTLVAAVTDKKIRVLQVMLMAAGTVTVRFESGASGTALSGQMELTAQTGFVLPYSPVGWFETASNTLLNLELSAAVSVDGLLVYVEV